MLQKGLDSSAPNSGTVCVTWSMQPKANKRAWAQPLLEFNETLEFHCRFLR